MAWTRGELWLDWDFTFGRDGAGTPALAGVRAPSLPGFSSPPGLVASRLRRAAWKRRRSLRRARATALVLSPAVILPLALFRTGGTQEGARAPVDATAITFRVADVVSPLDVRAGLGGSGVKRRPSLVVETQPAPAPDPMPKIKWGHATSTGLPFGGSLIDGTQLPIDGPNWVTWNPVTDSVPNAPVRLYGNDRAIHAVVSIAAAYRAAHPHAARIVVGDISREGGGPMTDEHVSHQNGLDVDIYYPRLDRRLRAPIAPDQVDLRLAQDLVDRFVAAGAQMIFVGYSTGLSGPSGVVIPYANHENHMHVRFRAPG